MLAVSNYNSSDPTIDSFFSRLVPYDLYTIDEGNTNARVGHFHAGKLLSVEKLKDEDTVDLPRISSSVKRNREEYLFNSLWQESSPAAFCDMPVHYDKNQLGADRLYQAAFAYNLYREQRTLIVDAGTFITVDEVTSRGFMGGFIYPGLNVFLSSYDQGDLLPALSTTDYNNEMIKDNPSTTKEAIISACHNYIKQLVSSLQVKKYDRIILTGGAASFLVPLMKQDHLLFAPYFIHHSLYYLYSRLRNNEVAE